MPQSPELNLESIPATLRELPQWVAWRYEMRGGKQTKMPLDAKTGGPGSSTDPSTWTGFDEAVAAWEAHQEWAGIGFVFAEGGGLCGVDLDNCIDQDTGEIKPWAKEIINKLSSYSEGSPSGRGVKVFIRATKPGTRCRRNWHDGHIEIYDKGRFFTVTGWALDSTPTEVQPRQAEVEAQYEEWFSATAARDGDAAKQPPAKVQPAHVQGALDDEEIIRLASTAKGAGAKFTELWAGRWEGRYPSHSEADAALVASLAFYTRDAAQLDRIFRRSGLMREKWDTKRGAVTYGSTTISSVLPVVGAQYSGSYRAPVTSSRSRCARQPTALWLANFNSVRIRGKLGRRIIPVAEIATTLMRFTDGWPRRVGSLLFTDQNGRAHYLETPEQLYAWVQALGAISWRDGRDSFDQSLVSRVEFFAHLSATATDYESVEDLPHEPHLPGSYYLWRPPQGYVPTGQYLQTVLDLFDNPETDADRLLLKAAFLTPAWGCLPGKRPAIAFQSPDRGCGKTTWANAISNVYRGHHDLSPKAAAEDRLVSRLLTPGEMGLRIVLMDNIKEGLDSALIEGLITAQRISGHRLYHGEASRPNTLTFLLTGNCLRLSRDLAERAFIIRMVKPTYRLNWEATLLNFVAVHRDLILADILAELCKPPCALSVGDRYADWACNVLGRCGGSEQVDAALTLNHERRDQCDQELDEAQLLMTAIDQHISRNQDKLISALQAAGDNSLDGAAPEAAFIASTDMTDIVNKALSERLSAKAVKARLTGHIEAGRLPRIKFRRTGRANGYEVHHESA